MLDFEAKKMALEEEAEKLITATNGCRNFCFFLPSGEVKLQGDLETWSFFFNEFLVVFVGDEIFPGPSYVGIF